MGNRDGAVMQGGTAFLFTIRLGLLADFALYSLTGPPSVTPPDSSLQVPGKCAGYQRPVRQEQPRGLRYGESLRYGEDGWLVGEWETRFSRMREAWPPLNWPGSYIAYPVGVNPLTEQGGIGGPSPAAHFQ